ncbi:MAG TPA: ECF-type sigma factor [Gemmataceae bacterium]|nr:ECF-type sigma factor [Gemmataceae bacterium]
MAQERPDHTLQPTALAHGAYLRLVGGHGKNACCRPHPPLQSPTLDSRGCFHTQGEGPYP